MRAVLAVAALVAAAGLAVAFSASAGPSPAQSESAVVWAVGDAATPGERADRVAALVRRADPDRFLYLGDVYETGTAKEFRQWYHPRFGRLAHITSPTIGNHEWDKRFEGYYRYWYRRKGQQMPPWFKTQHRRLGDPQPELAGAAQRRVCSGGLARVSRSRGRATAASRSGTARATARGPTAARRI